MKAADARESGPLGAAVPSLVRWGLSCDADVVFRTLATLGPRDVRTLVTELGMPRRRVDDALTELRTAGAIGSCDAEGRPPVWVPRPAPGLLAGLRRRRDRPPGPDVEIKPCGPGGVPDVALSDRERELIVLLAQGHTDAGAAARLRISARSVTNILRALMDRAGVDNRFQLGLALGATRDVPLPPA